MEHMLKRPLAALLIGVLIAALTIGGVAFAAPVASRAADTSSAKVVFEVQGMTCGGCEAPLEVAVRKLPGIEAVKASYPDGRAEVTYQPSRVSVRQIQEAIERLSYRATLVKAATAAPAATIATAAAGHAAETKPAAQTPAVTGSLRNLEGLKDMAEIFRQTRGQPRLVLLLSPT